MRVVHWTFSNGSGLNRVADMLCAAEREAGIDSALCYTDQGKGGLGSPSPGCIILPESVALEADIHVLHSNVPEKAKGKRVFVAHGTPEHCFTVSVEQMRDNYAGGDALGLALYWINRADAVVTFWSRHAALWKTMAPKQDIHVLPLGVDLSFWNEGASIGKWVGTPSVFNCENGHSIKWPLDVFLAWPLVSQELPDAALHAHYLPHNMHRFWFPLLYANGAIHKSYASPTFFHKDALRNAFKSSDFYLSPVRYGDHNTICMEARAAGSKVISYQGNPYAHFWIAEGDQRRMAAELVGILKGEAMERTPDPVPDVSEMAARMINVYKSLVEV